MKPAWNRRVTLTVIAILAILGSVLSYVMYAEHGYENGWSVGRVYPEGHAPVQPVEFSHRIHAGVRGISCDYCHQWVRTGDYAGVPPVSTCLNCHHQGGVTDGPSDYPKGHEKDEIAKLMAIGAAKQTISWTRVYPLPDHVHFTHKVHMWALQQDGKPATAMVCANCHGDLTKMDRVYEAKDLIRMGTCIECHDHPPENRMHRKGPNDCWECHK